MGYSLGAYHALFIAAAERAGSPLVGFDRYVTLDAPIQLLTGMRKVDAFYDGAARLPARRARSARAGHPVADDRDRAGEAAAPAISAG